MKKTIKVTDEDLREIFSLMPSHTQDYYLKLLAIRKDALAQVPYKVLIEKYHVSKTTVCRYTRSYNMAYRDSDIEYEFESPYNHKEVIQVAKQKKNIDN